MGQCARDGRFSADRSRTPDPPTILASRDTGGKVKVIDMNNFICGPRECKPVIGNVLVYIDDRHLTAAFGQYLKPRLLTAAPQLAK
jgi:SGNH domain (fused to AT3 domains)